MFMTVVDGQSNVIYVPMRNQFIEELEAVVRKHAWNDCDCFQAELSR